jgi:hypothetical protein
LANGETPQIPQDHGLSVYSGYEARAELKMRSIERLGYGISEIVEGLYGTGLDVIPVQSCKWSFSAMMGRPEEIAEVPGDVAARIQEDLPVVSGFNEGIRESAEIVANVDKGFEHCIGKFRNDLLVTATMRVEKGHHREYGWGVYFEQGRHRCILARTLANRPEEEAWEDTLWTACAEWASFEPVLGQPKTHCETLWAPDEFTHIFEVETFGQQAANASEYRLAQMARFAVGTQEFAQMYEWHSYADSDPPKRADYYAYHAAASRRIRISD